MIKLKGDDSIKKKKRKKKSKELALVDDPGNITNPKVSSFLPLACFHRIKYKMIKNAAS